MKFTQRLVLGYIRYRLKLIGLFSKKEAAKSAFHLFCTPQTRFKKEYPPVFKEGEKISVSAERRTVNGWRFNKGGKKKIMILHGFESSAANFDRYIKPFIRKEYEVLLFDAPAHGKSEGKTITAPLYKQCITEMYKQFGPFDSFMAHSFGSLALCLALEEISHDQSTRAVLIAPASESVSAIDSFFNFLKLDPAIRPEFDRIIIMKAGVSAEWFSIQRAMRNIKATILWIHDEDDNITPITDMYSIREKQFSNIEFMVTSGLGHRKIYRDNKVVKAVIDFL